MGANILQPPGTAPQSAGGGQLTATAAQVNPNKEFNIKIVTGSSPQNSGANVLILQGLLSAWVQSSLSCVVPDQSTVTVTSSVSASGNLAALVQYLALVGMSINYIRINTNVTSMYNYNLNYGVMPFNGRPAPAYWPLDGFAVPNGSGGFQNNLTIPVDTLGNPMNIALTQDTYMYFDTLPASATINVYFGVLGTGEQVINLQ